MRKIIDGKLYDTDTAEEICGHEYSNRGDFGWYAETLYRTAKGAFFIHGEGGAASKYSRVVGQNELSGGEKLVPVSLEKAKKFVEDNASIDVYIEFFGEVETA